MTVCCPSWWAEKLRYDISHIKTFVKGEQNEGSSKGDSIYPAYVYFLCGDYLPGHSQYWNCFFNLSVPWLSNNFVLTVCGGAFASMLVVLIGEVQKYFLNKKDAENFLFSHVGYIYGQLRIIKTHIQMRLDNPNEIVPAELLSMPLNYLKNEISLISNLDYYGFLKSNKLTKEYQNFYNIGL